MTYPKILLASSSIYRRQLLQKLRLTFDWASPDIDESHQPGESPAQLVCRLAETKARHLASTYPNHLIIGSDQVATIDNRILGKPYPTQKFSPTRSHLFDGPVPTQPNNKPHPN
jgi:septum formation protein